MDSEEYSEACQTSNIEHFAKVINVYKLLTVFAVHSILDIWPIPEYVSVTRASVFPLSIHKQELIAQLNTSLLAHFTQCFLNFFSRGKKLHERREE